MVWRRRCFGRCWREIPQGQDPLGRNILGHREQLRVVAPELLANPGAQAHALLLELLGQA